MFRERELIDINYHVQYYLSRIKRASKTLAIEDALGNLWVKKLSLLAAAASPIAMVCKYP
jgi:hypothetical protein